MNRIVQIHRVPSPGRLVWLLAAVCWMTNPPCSLAQPTIVSTVPVNMGTATSPTAPFVVTFSESMDTTNTSVDFIDLSTMADLSTTPAWSANNNVLTCSPTSPWPVQQTIVWFVDGAAPDGTPLGGNAAGEFTVSPAAPSSPPPSSLAGSMLTVTVNSGSAPFASSGSYWLFAGLWGTNYNVLGPNGPLSFGTLTYSATADTGSGVLMDAVTGTSAALTLTFTSPSNGTLALSNSTGFQTGTFTLATYVASSPPQLFQPSFAGGQFQCFLGGQPGFVYTVETSSDLINWRPLQTLALTDVTTNFVDTPGGTASFYAAPVGSPAFAPANLTNKTFNVTITSGALPLATNGICQWLADTNDSGYEVLGGPGTVNSSGTYGYSPTSPNSALLASFDSIAGALSEKLFFTSPQSGYFYASNMAGFESGTFKMAEGPVQFLGNVSFTPDAARAQTLSFAGAGLPASLSVTNAAGWVWILDFPGDALAGPQTITMTPFATVDFSQSLLPLTNGVLLEPDGLQFDDGVTLSATPPGPMGPYAALMQAEGDGSSLYFVGGANQAGGLSATLFHFSSAVATDPSEAQWSAFTLSQLPRARLAYAQATNAMHSLMAHATNLPPPPPDFMWTCSDISPDAGTQKKIDNYIQSVFAAENAAIVQLMSAAWELSASGSNYMTTATNLVKKLIETDEFGQVNTLLARYYTMTNVSDIDTNFNGEPTKFVAVYRLSWTVNQQDICYGGKTNTTWTTLCKNWSKAIRDGCVKQVHDNHIYSMAPIALNVETFRNTVMNIPIDSTGAFQTKMAKALVFALTVDMNLNFKDWDSEGTVSDVVSEEVKGDAANLQGGITTPYPVSTNLIPIISGSWANPLDDCSYSLDPGKSSTWAIGLGIRPCDQPAQVYLTINGPYPPEETWTGCGETSTTGPWVGGIYGAAIVCATGANGSGGLFRFPLQDGQVQIVNQAISGDSTSGNCSDPYQEATATVQIQIDHTPQ